MWKNMGLGLESSSEGFKVFVRFEMEWNCK